MEKRGLQRSIIDLFELGFAIKNHKLLIRFLESKKISLEEQIKSRIIQKGKDNSFYGYFSGRIIFPIFDENSQLIAFGGRVLTSNYSPKYLNSPENFLFIKKKILYGLNFAKQVLSERKKLYIVEGYLDVIILHQNGFENSVAPLGTSFTQEHFLKASFYTKKIVLLFDGDEAGEKASYRVFEQYLNLDIETELELYIVALPENYDPLSYINEFGIDNFKNILKKEEKFSFFYIKKQIRLLESESSNLIKKKVLHDIYGTIQKIKSEVEKEDILYYLSTLLRIRRQAVLKDFQYFDDNNKKMQNRWIKKEENKAVEAIEPEKYLVLFLIHHIDYFLKYQERILNLLLEDSFANKVLNIILEFNRIEDIKKNEDIHYDYFFHFLISKLDSVDKNFVQKEIFNEKYYIDSDNQIEEIFDQIYLKRIKNQIEKINIRFDELKSEKDIDADKLKNLMEEKHYWINEYFKYKKR